jgi:adenylate cyclase class IV
MTIYEHIEALGFKKTSDNNNHTRYKKRNVEICVQEWISISLYVEITKRTHTIELSTHNIKDVEKAVELMKKFIRETVGK